MRSAAGFRRLADLALALVLLAPAALLCAAVAAAVLIADGRPVLHLSPRATVGGRVFRLCKFRTMRPDPADSGITGGNKDARITRLGRLLRRTHLDELPQIVNILRGDMGFVGPRPPLPALVARFPEVYLPLLGERPGLTGLASLVFRRHEARLLRDAPDQAAADFTYARRCIPAKARLDALRRDRGGPLLDLAILAGTLAGGTSLPFRHFRRRLRRHVAPLTLSQGKP